MILHSYDRMYLPDVADNLGAMMDCGVNRFGLTPSEMFSRFIAAGFAYYIEIGSPRYLSGLSGIEIAEMTTGLSAGEDLAVFPGAEYWAGWALAHLQWESGLSFSDLVLFGMDIDSVLAMYNPYHEADISKFVTDALELIRMRRDARPSRLKAIRKAAGITQEELSERTGVPLRTIRSYEQESRSLQKAEAGSLLAICSVLHCRPDALQ